MGQRRVQPELAARTLEAVGQRRVRALVLGAVPVGRGHGRRLRPLPLPLSTLGDGFNTSFVS